MSSSSSSDTLTAEPLNGGSEFKAQPAPTPAALLAPTNNTPAGDGIGSSSPPLQQQPPPKSNHALFTMLDYTLTPVALAVLISLVLVALASLALMALAVKRTLWDKSKRNNAANNAHNRPVYDSKRPTAIIYDVSDGGRTNRSASDGASRSNASSTSSSGSTSCLVGLLVAASFVGVAVGMAFAIDRTVVALC